jgi:stearoyl-CoA desaturase (delta-9 desaturase)
LKLISEILVIIMVKSDEKAFKPKLAWFNIFAFIYMHLTTLYIIYDLITGPKFPYLSVFVGYVMGFCCLIYGTIIGAHRMWSHKAFKARWPTRLFLGFFQTMAGQNSIYEWCRDHRVHHKFSDTTADPHNINNGFFFSHMGWLCMEKHPDVKTKGKTVDMSDLEKDWIVRYQKKYYTCLYVIIAHLLPTLIIHYVCGETLLKSWSANIVRYVVTLHITWATNSFAHSVGYRPYDKNIKPTEFIGLGWIGGGEGWHNFHHTFPWDYKMSEQTQWELTYIWKTINFLASIGQVYDMKTVSQEIIKKRVLRTGDGTHPYSKLEQNNNNNQNSKSDEKSESALWGWDDKDITKNDINATTIHHDVKSKAN